LIKQLLVAILLTQKVSQSCEELAAMTFGDFSLEMMNLSTHLTLLKNPEMSFYLGKKSNISWGIISASSSEYIPALRQAQGRRCQREIHSLKLEISIESHL